MKKNLHNEGSNVERSNERIIATGEVFTPMELCARIVDNIPDNILQNPKSTFIDNSAGSGNFMVALQIKLSEYHSLDHINNSMLYAVELMEDNHKEMCERLGVGTDHPHYICNDALTYDYSFGNPVGLEEFFI
jgi:hypothetical protein